MLQRLARSRYAFPVAIVAIAAIAGIVVLIAQGGGDDGGSEQAACEEIAAPAPRQAQVERPDLRLDRGRAYTATIDTNCGTFAIELDVEELPRTSASFVALARDGFYDGLGFHRIAPGFVIQGGDPAGDGTGGPGYKTREAPPDDVVYSEGVVAMAKGGNEAAGTAGSQFFVVTAPDAGLPADYAVLGKVVRGMDVVKLIEAQAPPDTPQQGGPPAEPVVMQSVEISESEDVAQ